MWRMLAIGAVLTLAMMVSSAAPGADNEFAVGSAKTEIDLAGGTEFQHASFSAHSTGNGCEATGHVFYKGLVGATALDIEVDVTHLIVLGTPLPVLGNEALFW